ncbi:hypothetical protein [Bacillus sonorensis]|nr:hypothetical protein [Bacillus sonorensis]
MNTAKIKSSTSTSSFIKAIAAIDRDVKIVSHAGKYWHQLMNGE